MHIVGLEGLWTVQAGILGTSRTGVPMCADWGSVVPSQLNSLQTGQIAYQAVGTVSQ